MRKAIFCLCILLVITELLMAQTEQEKSTTEEKGWVLPVILNTLPGFGFGSFFQGDIFGGFISLAGEGVGGTMYFIGGTKIFYGLTHEIVELDTNILENYLLIFKIGASIYLGTKIFSLIRPILYAANYNKKQREAMAPNDVACGTVSLIPVCNCNENGTLLPGVLLIYAFN